MSSRSEPRTVLPDYLGAIVVAAIRQFESMLASGALVVVDEGRSVARLLPLLPTPPDTPYASRTYPIVGAGPAAPRT